MQFYILSLKSSASSYASLNLVGSAQLEGAPTCPDCGTELGLSKTLPPYRYLLKGKKIGDLHTDGLDIAVSNRFCERYKQSGLTGVHFSNDEIHSKNIPSGYRMAFPEVTLTKLYESASGLDIDEVYGCSRCRVVSRNRLERIVIDEKTLEGWDMFTCGNLFGRIIVTERFVNFIGENELTNFQFISQDEYSENFFETLIRKCQNLRCCCNFKG